MKKLFFLSITSLALLAQAALTKEEKLELENAGLRLQLLKVQEQETQKRAKEVFESACKRANIPADKCQLDQAKGELVKQEDPKTK